MVFFVNWTVKGRETQKAAVHEVRELDMTEQLKDKNYKDSQI